MGSIISIFSSWDEYWKQFEEIGVCSPEFETLNKILWDIANQRVKVYCEKNPVLDKHKLTEWLTEFAYGESSLLLTYKEAALLVIQQIEREECGENKKIFALSGVFNNCLYEKILASLKTKNKALNHQLNPAEFPLVEEIKNQVKLATSKLQAKKEELCVQTKSLYQAFCTNEKVKNQALAKIQEQINNDYYQEIENLAVNIYLARVQKTLQELNNYLENSRLETETINRLKRELQTEIKNVPFSDLENWKQKKNNGKVRYRKI